MNTFGLFNSPKFQNRTLMILNGEARLINTEQAVKAATVNVPNDVWNALTTAPYSEVPASVLDSDSWVSRGSNRTDYKLSYGLPDDYEIVTDLKSYKLAGLSVKEICKAAGMTQTAVAERFGIPRRTMEDWCRGVSKCPIYTRLMMQECLGLIKR